MPLHRVLLIMPPVVLFRFFAWGREPQRTPVLLHIVALSGYLSFKFDRESSASRNSTSCAPSRLTNGGNCTRTCIWGGWVGTYACSTATHHHSTFTHTISQVSSQSSLKCFSSAQHQEKPEIEQAQDGQPAPTPRHKSRKLRAKMILTAKICKHLKSAP